MHDDTLGRGELYGVERLETFAEALASSPVRRAGDGATFRVERELAMAAASLRSACSALEDAVQDGRSITQAARWLIENVHVIEEQFTDLADALPRSLIATLPRWHGSRTVTTPPRIYDALLGYLRHSDGAFDDARLRRFVAAFQRDQPLEMRELWALPALLRLGLLKMLAAIATRTADAMRARRAADLIADRAMDNDVPTSADSDGGLQSQRLLEEALAQPALGPFAVQLVQRLRYAGPRAANWLAPLDAALAREGQTLDSVVSGEHSRQSATNVTVRNLITSFRDVAAHEWRRFFEQTSCVEAELAKLASYQAADSATRTRYRDAIEELAAETPCSEVDVALRLQGSVEDVGHYLIGPGRVAFERQLRIVPTFNQRLRRRLMPFAAPLYLAALGMLSLACLWIAARLGLPSGMRSVSAGLLLALGLIPASELALGLLNRLLMALFPPRRLPRLALREGIPEASRTLLVIPVLLSDPADVRHHLRQLEVHSLANPDREIRFALLSDWPDAATENLPSDEAVLAALAEGIAALNAKHAAGAQQASKFFALHRRRLWNAGERCWMGWERKRGKLTELNALLLHGERGSFVSDPQGVLAIPDAIRYVVTLDADTRLPYGAIARLVGIASHPLNRPRFDDSGRRVVAGYGIIQPRVVPLLPRRGERSFYRRIVTGASGLDPYAGAVSDVYQDVFGEGSFTGKGLYDLQTFEQALRGRIPDNTVLSHDLLEGLFARCGLASDVECYEDFPSHSEVGAARQHRWARGDWQLLPWLLTTRGSGVGLLGRWKLFDNLRRTLLAPAAIATLLLAWAVPDSNALVWLALIVAPAVLPGAITSLSRLITAPFRRSLTPCLRCEAVTVGADMRTAFVSVVLLAQNAWLMIDAIARALVRQFLTHRRRLEWITAAQARALASYGLRSFVWSMRGSSTIVVGTAVALMALYPPGLSRAAPLLLLWWLAPVLARRFSLAVDSAPRAWTPGADDLRTLRLTARTTFRFFTTWVTADDHWLPPDNVQETPREVVARRTSPTNIGLYLLVCATAQEFGWWSLREATRRIAATLDSLRALERHQGHFFNWYDTATALPLEPRYVSTVDSGNLAGHLIALAQWCAHAAASSFSFARCARGLGDTLALVSAAASALPDTPPGASVGAGELQNELARAAHLLVSMEGTDADARSVLLEFTRLAAHIADLAAAFAGERSGTAQTEFVAWSQALRDAAVTHAAEMDASPADITETREALERMAQTCERFVTEMNFTFLYDARRNLFSIGWRAADGQLDASFYDLLASEARMTSLVAIAKGDVPVRHWNHLGRRLTGRPSRPLLVSWSGSMFEYLMPALVMREPAGGLLDETAARAVDAQIRYAKARAVPWGISESAYNVRDAEFTYQYSAFGVPELGLKRGLERNLVVAPYATMLAAMYRPRESLANFTMLEGLGARGRFGFYESIDFTRERLPAGVRHEVVRTYMAHHQGMSIVALGNVVARFPTRDDDSTARGMRRHFHADARIQAAELLLEEQAPGPAARPRTLAEQRIPARVFDESAEVERSINDVNSDAPVLQILSNRRYAVAVTAAGGGYSTWNGIAVTRWRDDATRDAHGSWLYLRDVTSGSLWSAAFQPTRVPADRYEAHFSEERATIERWDSALHSRLEIVVSPEDDAELRRLTLDNHGDVARELEITSYCEIVLAPLAADLAHRAFSNLFVQTEWAEEVHGTLLARRRPRSSAEVTPWAGHVISASGEVLESLQYETDRARFLGRNGDASRPAVLKDSRPLSNTTGAVLDPVFSMRAHVRIPPHGSCQVCFTTFAATSREEALSIADRHRQRDLFERVAMQAWTFARAGLHHLRIDLAEARLFQILAGPIVFGGARWRAERGVLTANDSSQADLWRFGISGDRPIVLIRCAALDDLDSVQQILRAQEYWRTKQLLVDVVVLNERGYSYEQELQLALEDAVRSARAWSDRVPGGTAQPSAFAIAGRTLSEREHRLLLSAARVILVPADGSLAEQVARRLPAAGDVPLPSSLVAPGSAAAASFDGAESKRDAASARDPATQTLEFDNGFGGFAADGREYVIASREGRLTPLPWSNVIANEAFGALVTESGSTCTWSLNSHENLLTPWSNDAVSDPTGEALYLRDLDSGLLWSPVASPIRQGDAQYRCTHGQGYSRFDCSFAGIDTELWIWVDADCPVKWFDLRIVNRSSQRRRLAVTAFVEWVLGPTRAGHAPFVVSEHDAESGALLARNPWNRDFAAAVAWLDLQQGASSWTASRREFLGRHGSLTHPEVLELGATLSGRIGGGLDPCAALSKSVRVERGASAQLTFTLGQGSDRSDALAQLAAARTRGPVDSLQQVRERWDARLGVIQIHTPDRALDLLANRWLLYQLVSSRLWARAGFYQAGGAYGFRDQLQDVLALLSVEPGLARAQILRAAEHQFLEGDVQHWWHPPSGRGVRTRFTDDRVWLPYVVSAYLQTTGDAALLDELRPFIEGAAVAAGHEDAHYEPSISQTSGTVYEHCARALDISLGAGAHDLPLMGGGDWNDGMNRVGIEGRGESVWMAWFLIDTLRRFAPLAQARGAHARAASWTASADRFAAACESAGWDGAWYRRAYFDDGTPLGSAGNAECRIDSIAQSWAVISGAAPAQRAAQAMEAVAEYLLRDADDLMLLFAPPFDRSSLEPGYIKGYLPGLRENGGQYSHAAVWSLIAFAMLGRTAEVAQLLEILNPVQRAATRRGSAAYKGEPYVMPADIYSEPPHARRAGWTWYTGAAGWMHRAIVEWVLGVRIRHDRIEFAPCLPPSWPSCAVTYRGCGAYYEIAIDNGGGGVKVERIELDGVLLVSLASTAEFRVGSDGVAPSVPLVRDGVLRHVRVQLA